jgi:hypothetical protein
LEIQTFLDEEMSQGFACFTPALSEAVLVIGTPGIQLAKWRQFRMIAEQLDERAIAGRHEREEVISDFLSKRLRSAFTRWFWLPVIFKQKPTKQCRRTDKM